MKYKLDFKIPLKRLNDTPIESEALLNVLLAQNLESYQDQACNARKLGFFAYDLYKTGELELDTVDLKVLEDWIEKNPNFSVLFKCNLLDVFKNKIEVL